MIGLSEHTPELGEGIFSESFALPAVHRHLGTIAPTAGTPRAAKGRLRFGASLAAGTGSPAAHLYPREQIYSSCLGKVPASERMRSQRFFHPVLSA